MGRRSKRRTPERESLFVKLTRHLLKDKRYNDLEKGTIDPEYRKKLYEEYHFISITEKRAEKAAEFALPGALPLSKNTYKIQIAKTLVRSSC